MAATGDGGSYQLGLDQPRTSLSANNFGGRGPQLNDPPYVQFNNVGILGGTYFNLRIENMSFYRITDSKSKDNGRNGFFGALEVSRGDSVSMRFSFLDSSDNPITLVDPFFFEVYDLDGRKSGGTVIYDEVSVCSVDSSRYLHPETNLVTTNPSGGCIKASAPIADAPVSPNPYHPVVGVPEAQLKSSVSFKFENVPGFDLNFSATWDTSEGSGCVSQSACADSGSKGFAFSFGSAVAYSATSCGLSPLPLGSSGTGFLGVVAFLRL